MNFNFFLAEWLFFNSLKDIIKILFYFNNKKGIGKFNILHSLSNKTNCQHGTENNRSWLEGI